jgi:hypothetical protein
MSKNSVDSTNFRIFAKIMKSGRENSISWTAAIPVIVGVAVYGFWYFGHPEVLMSQEQSQLFVWDSVYLHDRLEMPGGWGDYLWSSVVQFFCSPMQGAFTMALLCVVLQLLSMWLFHRLLRKRWRVVSALLSLILPVLLCVMAYKPVGGSMEELEYDYLLRLGKWEEIVDKDQQNKTMMVSCQNAVRIALWKTGRLEPQYLQACLMNHKESLTSRVSAYMMSDIYMMIGQVGMAQRAAFEAMESIEDYDKSGRALMRLTETSLITGRPEVALKYISLLERTLFYRSWAKKMRPLAEHPELLKGTVYEQLKQTYEKSENLLFY